jgi:hypothetical protein
MRSSRLASFGAQGSGARLARVRWHLARSRVSEKFDTKRPVIADEDLWSPRPGTDVPQRIGHRRTRPDVVVVGDVGDATPENRCKAAIRVSGSSWGRVPLRARVPTSPRSSPRSASWRRCSPQHPRSASWRRYSPRRQSQRSGVGARRTARDRRAVASDRRGARGWQAGASIAAAEAGKLAPAIAAAPERGRAQSESWHRRSPRSSASTRRAAPLIPAAPRSSTRSAS